MACSRLKEDNNMELPKEFFTVQSMLTLTGATSAVLILGNTYQSLLERNPKWFAFGVAQAIAFAGVYSTGGRALDYFVALVNGCLIFAASTGLSAITGKPPKQVSRVGEPTSRERARVFITRWF
jgi:hypothetical protein